MSSKSRGRRSKKPSDQRRAQAKVERQIKAEEAIAELEDHMRRGSRELAELTSPLVAEVYASSLLNVWRLSVPDNSTPEKVDAVVGDLIMKQVEKSPDKDTVGLLRALIALDAQPFAAAARTKLDSDLKLIEKPAWAAKIGTSKLRSCSVVRHELGDVDELILTYVYDENDADEKPHTLQVWINHNLGGAAVDMRVDHNGPALHEETQLKVDKDPRLSVSEISPEEVRELLEHGFAVTAEAENPPVKERYHNFTVFARARMLRLPEPSTPTTPAVSEVEQEDIVNDFVDSPEAQGLPAESARAIATEIVSYGAENDRGRPLRVSATKLQVLLLGWLPRTGLLAANHVPHVPDVVPAFVRYAARRTGLSQESLDEILETLPDITGQFAEAYHDKERWSPERAAIERLLADVDPAVEDIDDAFARRMFALHRMPDEDFDPDDEESFRRMVEEEHAQSPEFAEAKISSSREWSPTLHIDMHTIIAKQLWNGEPPETWATAKRLLDEGLERHDVLHALAYVASEEIYHAVSNGKTHGPEEYRAALDALPQSWYAALEADRN